jgi:hypothetical protein
MNISTSNKKLKALKRLFYFVTIIMFGLSFSSCADRDSTDWQTRINKDYGYKIKYPKTWELAKTEGKSPSTKSINLDKFQKEGKVICPSTGLFFIDAELSIIVEENSGLSLERWLNENQKEQSPDINCRFVTTELPYKIGGQKAIKVITKFENQNKPSKEKVDKGDANIYIMKNDKIYNFDFRNRRIDIKKFETICEAMMKSFAFIKNE